MRTVLVQTKGIQKVIDKDDVCLVIMEDGKTWVCEKQISGLIWKKEGIPVKKFDVSTVDYIQDNQGDTFIKLPLKAKDGEQK